MRDLRHQGRAARVARYASVFLFLFALTDCRDRATEKGELVLRDLRLAHPCTSTSILIQGRFGVSQADACTVTMAVRHAIALGGASGLGISPTDSALIDTSMVATVRLPKTGGDRVAFAAWTVRLSFQGKAKSIEAYVDQHSGRVRFEPTEP